MYRFPNLCVAVITRESCRQAFRGGITANQIVRFLNMHAHNQSKESAGPPIPPTISDQVGLLATPHLTSSHLASPHLASQLR